MMMASIAWMQRLEISRPEKECAQRSMMAAVCCCCCCFAKLGPHNSLLLLETSWLTKLSILDVIIILLNNTIGLPIDWELELEWVGWNGDDGGAAAATTEATHLMLHNLRPGLCLHHCCCCCCSPRRYYCFGMTDWLVSYGPSFVCWLVGRRQIISCQERWCIRSIRVSF